MFRAASSAQESAALPQDFALIADEAISAGAAVYAIRQSVC